MSHTILNMRWMLITEVRSAESKYDTNMKYCLAGEIHRRKLKNRTLVRRSIICQKLHQNTCWRNTFCQNVLHIFCGFSNELEKTWTVFYDAKKKWQIRICVYHYQVFLSALAYNDDTENNPKIAFGSFCWVSQFEQTEIRLQRYFQKEGLFQDFGNCWSGFWKLLMSERLFFEDCHSVHIWFTRYKIKKNSNELWLIQ